VEGIFGLEPRAWGKGKESHASKPHCSPSGCRNPRGSGQAFRRQKKALNQAMGRLQSQWTPCSAGSSWLRASQTSALSLPQAVAGHRGDNASRGLTWEGRSCQLRWAEVWQWGGATLPPASALHPHLASVIRAIHHPPEGDSLLAGEGGDGSEEGGQSQQSLPATKIALPQPGSHIGRLWGVRGS
jgi:hypothetical protein